MISKLELRSLQKEKHFGCKAEIAQKHLSQQQQIQLEIELRQFFRWLQSCSTTQAFR
jgi:hypothetical protein